MGENDHLCDLIYRGLTNHVPGTVLGALQVSVI